MGKKLKQKQYYQLANKKCLKNFISSSIFLFKVTDFII